MEKKLLLIGAILATNSGVAMQKSQTSAGLDINGPTAGPSAVQTTSSAASSSAQAASAQTQKGPRYETDADHTAAVLLRISEQGPQATGFGKYLSLKKTVGDNLRRVIELIKLSKGEVKTLDAKTIAEVMAALTDFYDRPMQDIDSSEHDLKNAKVLVGILIRQKVKFTEQLAELIAKYHKNRQAATEIAAIQALEKELADAMEHLENQRRAAEEDKVLATSLGQFLNEKESRSTSPTRRYSDPRFFLRTVVEEHERSETAVNDPFIRAYLQRGKKNNSRT